jgi:hypothetical protein
LGKRGGRQLLSLRHFLYILPRPGVEPSVCVLRRPATMVAPDVAMDVEGEAAVEGEEEVCGAADAAR